MPNEKTLGWRSSYCGAAGNASAEITPLDKLASDFWEWHAKYAPFSGDDVNRIERPGGTREWVSASIDKQRKNLGEFETRWKRLDPTLSPIPQQIDYQLIGSALARVRWELDINPRSSVNSPSASLTSTSTRSALNRMKL